MAISLPPILIPSRTMFIQENASRSGGVSITGAEQVVVSGGGRWRAQLSFPVGREEWVLSWRALIARLQGRARTVLVTPFDAYAPADINGRRLPPIEGAPIESNDGGLLFSDTSAFGQDEATYVTLAANASLGATRITVTGAASWMVPRPGQYFGIGENLYMAELVYQASVSTTWTIDFSPRLRAAAVTGARIITDRPMCTMRLADDKAGELALDYSRWGAGVLDLVEAV
jgi:hypothetical protein